MQFRKDGTKIQVLKYMGYDKAKRRSVVKMVGSFSISASSIPQELAEALTDEERAEVQSYIEKMRQADKESEISRAGGLALWNLMRVGRMLDQVEFDVAREIRSQEGADVAWAAIKAIEAALTKAGYPRPKRSYKSQKNADVGGATARSLPLVGV